MFAVCVADNDEIPDMASVTRDTEKMWQIGVNVTKEGEGNRCLCYLSIERKAFGKRNLTILFYGRESY